MKNNGFSRIGCFLFLIILLFFVFFPRKEIKSCSNEEILDKYKKDFYSDSAFLCQLSTAFDETNIKDTMAYSLASYDGGVHRLRWHGRDYTDSFPRIREIIKNEFPNAKDCYYDILFINRTINISIYHNSLFNKNKHCVCLLYSKEIDNIKSLYPNYKFYNNEIPNENDSWLYLIEKNWYILSPDH